MNTVAAIILALAIVTYLYTGSYHRAEAVLAAVAEDLRALWIALGRVTRVDLALTVCWIFVLAGPNQAEPRRNPAGKLCVDRVESGVPVLVPCAPEGWDAAPVLKELRQRDPGGDIIL